MPEVLFVVRWPDGAEETCYSPSRVIKDYFAPGESYPLADFVESSRAALTIASDRVRAKYGMGCGRALAQISRIEEAAAGFAHSEAATVTVIAFEE
jgi:uncharacterized repeat protein (TIGR04042 family)